jgi:REP element-mobilizing transposase RayT
MMTSTARRRSGSPSRRSRPRQVDLDLRTWGGRRAGAGRKPRGPQAGISHAPRPPVASAHPVPVTLRVRRHVFNLRSRRCFRVIRAAFVQARERHGMRLVHFSVQGNHLHLFVEARGRDALSRGMHGLSIRLARGLNGAMDRRGPVFADRYHAHVLKTPVEVRNALRYLLTNGEHHGTWWRGRRGSVIDPYTSGRWFDGWRGGLPPTAAGPPGTRRAGPPGGRKRSEGIPAPDDPAPVSPPRTWLARVGWRRHGLLDLPRVRAETPARAPRRAA